MTAAAPKIVAVLDACVLYPPSLRDLLMWLGTVRAYEPRWTEEIHAEWHQSRPACRRIRSAPALKRRARPEEAC